MSTNIPDQAEVDRLARLFTKALFNLHSDSTASTTPARLSSIITEEPPSRSLPLALAKASLGFATAFEDLLNALIRTLKAVLSYDRVKQLSIDDAEHGSQTFVYLLEHDFHAELKDAYRSGALSFALRDEDGALNNLNPCLSAAFFSAGALTQGFTAMGQYHRVVALSALKIGGTESSGTSDVEQSLDASEAYAIATLIAFAIVGADKYAKILAEGGVTYESVRDGLKGLRTGGVVRQAQTVSLMDTVIGDLDEKSTRGRSEAEVRGLIFGGAGVV